MSTYNRIPITLERGQCAWLWDSEGKKYLGFFGGIVTIVTKSGPTDLHGHVYAYLQNNASAASSLLQQPPQGDVQRPHPGGVRLQFLELLRADHLHAGDRAIPAAHPG